jgi:ketosteroid isomerase-like protein
MHKTLLTLLLLTMAFSGFAQKGPEASIRQIMADQAAAWNKGNIDEFMKGYWNNDSLVFVGHTGLNYGYAKTLAGYKQRYDSPDKMGQLFFTLLSIKQLSPDYCFVLGKWLLKRKIGDVGGIYSLLFRKIDGRWQIVVDHTS